MNRAFLKSTVAAAALVAGFAGVPASADAATVTHNYGVVYSGFGDFSGFNFDLDLFDSNLGTLQSVVISESLRVNSSVLGHEGLVALHTFAMSASSTSPSPTATTTLSIAGGPSALNGSAAGLTTLLSQGIFLDGLGGGPTSAMYTPDVTTTPTDITVLAGLLGWQAAGGGTNTLTLGGSTTTMTDPYGNWQLFWPGGGPQTEFSLSITYDYEAPEPASMLVLGAGLLGLGLARRKWRMGKQAPPIEAARTA